MQNYNASSNYSVRSSSNNNEMSLSHLPPINKKSMTSTSPVNPSTLNNNNNNNNHQNKNAKYYPFIDKNQAFKYIRDRLANKHLENANKPNFDKAEILPIFADEKAALNKNK